MRISVVTVSFNSAQTIGFTLESFFGQDYADKELVIIDGGSTDHTLKVVASFPMDNTIVISEPDRGIYDAMNKGLGRFTGDAVGFLNSDDRYKDKGALSQIAAGLGIADVVFGNLDFVSDHRSGKIVRRWRSTPYKKGAFKQGWMPAHPTFYMRRQVAERVGGFDLGYRIAADYDYMLRALEVHEQRAVLVDRVLVEMLQGGSSTSGLKSHIAHNREALRSRQQWLGAGAVDYALFAKPLRKVAQILVH